jgi:acetate kinase
MAHGRGSLADATGAGAAARGRKGALEFLSAQAALALYVRRIVREIGALTAVLDGLDMLVFTAGIGEHNAAIRERVCRGLGFLGITLDDAANADDAPLISAPDSKVVVAVERTNEEWIAAVHGLGATAAA